MAKEEQQQIIVKRIKKSGGGHHGGAWKIAYADFVTAMMAFFLLMWLLGSTAKGDLAGIAEYFSTPLKVALMGGSGAGDATSVIQGGGTDLTRTAGQKKQGEQDVEKKKYDARAAEAERARQERNRLLELKAKLDAAIDANDALKPYKKQLRVDLTPDGLRIQIVDEQNRAMFDSWQRRAEGLHADHPARAGQAHERCAEQDLAVGAHRRQGLFVGRARLQQLGAVCRSRQRLAPRAHRRRHR